jgi:hypothetical protein
LQANEKASATPQSLLLIAGSGGVAEEGAHENNKKKHALSTAVVAGTHV